MSARLAAVVLAAPLALTGCQRVTRDMAYQQRHDPASTSPLFDDGAAERPPPAGSVAHAQGDRALVGSGRIGLAADRTLPAAVDSARGAERYAIYCLPCHGVRGDGDGEVVRRGFPAPPPFAALALRAAPDARLHDVIRLGSGTMFPFADRVSDADAWAIVAYLRVLQHAAPAAQAAASAPGAMR